MAKARKKPDSDEPATPKPARKAAPKKTGTAVAKAKSRVADDDGYDVPGTARGYDLVVVESPAKAKTINKYLGSKFKVLASYGHVRDLATNKKGIVGEEIAGIRIDDGWKLRYVVDAGSKTKKKFKGRRTQEDIISELRSAAKKAGRVLLASDPDREGESIAWHIADELQLDPATTWRITFNEITKSAIQAAMNVPEQINMERVKAQEARRAMDRVVGFPLSNLLSEKITYGLSAGRVQSVAVKVIVDRELEIQAFKTEEYWRLTALLTPDGTLQWVPKQSKILAKKKAEKKPDAAPAPAAEGDEPELTETGEEVETLSIPKAPPGSFLAELAKWNGGEAKIGNEADADRMTAEIANLPYTVTNLEQKDRSERPQPPFTTSTLQQTANIRLRFTAKRTMDTAQRLYEGIELEGLGQTALITYMRTDSTRVSNDALGAVRGRIKDSFGDRYLPEKANFYASGKGAQEAHEAVRPTDVSLDPRRAESLGLFGDQLKLYTLIYNRFMASQMTPALFAVTSVDVTAGPATFKASGRIMRFDGYRKVMPPAGKQEDTELPALSLNQTLRKLDLFETQHFTQPPSRYNEASLVRMLEKEGIGRPSTYASIISTIQDRGYVEQKDRRFFATPLGIVVTKLLVDHFPKIMDLKFTSHFEEELDEIETGKYQYADVLNEFWGPFKETLARAKVEMPAQKAVETGEKCPDCGKPLITLVSRISKKPFVGCSGYRDETPCRYIKPGEGEEARPKPEPTEFNCPKCGKMMLKRVGKTGPFLGCSDYPKCKTTMNIGADGQPVLSAVETEYKCEKCDSPMIRREGRNGPFLGCSGYPKCKSIVNIDAEGKPVKPVDLGIKCEKCNSPMGIKRGPRGPFLGCTGYPKCRNIMKMTDELKEQLKDVLPKPVPKKEMPKVEIDVKCGECGGEMRLQKSRFGGRYFLGCSKYPKCKGTAKLTPALEAKIAEAEAATPEAVPAE